MIQTSIWIVTLMICIGRCQKCYIFTLYITDRLWCSARGGWCMCTGGGGGGLRQRLRTFSSENTRNTKLNLHCIIHLCITHELWYRLCITRLQAFVSPLLVGWLSDRRRQRRRQLQWENLRSDLARELKILWKDQKLKCGTFCHDTDNARTSKSRRGLLIKSETKKVRNTWTWKTT